MLFDRDGFQQIQVESNFEQLLVENRRQPTFAGGRDAWLRRWSVDRLLLRLATAEATVGHPAEILPGATTQPITRAEGRIRVSFALLAAHLFLHRIGLDI